jgi:hypothetical protein
LWDIPTPDQVAFFSELRTLLKANQSATAAGDSAQGSILFFGWNIASSYATDDDAGLLRVTGVAEEAEENVADALAKYNSLVCLSRHLAYPLSAILTTFATAAPLLSRV